MKFSDFVSHISTTFKIADKSDNQIILDLYNSLSMEGGVFSFKFVKDPDYYNFCDYVGREHYITLAINNDGEAEYMATFGVRLSYLNGNKVKVCHVYDLRCKRKKDRKASFSWLDLTNAIFTKSNEIDELKDCTYFLGSYTSANKYAIRTIKDTSPWGVSDVSKYDMVSILGRRPLKYLGIKSFPKSDLNVSISQAKENDIPELKKYLDAQNREKAFGYIYDIEDGELERRFNVWDDFSISSFYLARGTDGELLGCLATWNPSKGRRIVVDNFPRTLALMSKGLKLLGKKIPEINEELEILYITNLELNYKLTTEQKRFVFNEFLDALYKSGVIKKYHLLAFCDYYKEMLSPGLEKYYVLHKTPTILYQVCPKDVAVDVIKEDALKYPPGHEMVLT
jgi:hypothetical protein